MKQTTVMVIYGGPRQNGATANMLQCFTELLSRSAVEHSLPPVAFVRYTAYACGFAPCTDCRACSRSEGCVQRDMDDFFRDFETADALIFATPIYNMSFPAPLKTILDRMQRYYNARFSLGKRPPIVKRRPAVLLMAAGSPDENGSIAVRQLERSFTVTNCALVGHCIRNGTDQPEGSHAVKETLAAKLEQCAAALLENV